jgi:signal transduction histidine kinase
MREIIIDLLEYSQVNDRFKLLKDIDLNKVVSYVRLLYRRKIEELGATITVDLLPIIRSYEYPIETIISNLVDNALEYRHQDRTPEINISASDYGNHWSISVRDNGIGISPEYYAKIFVIFQRLNPRIEHSGTGVGLAIVKKLVDGLGGEITVQSEDGSWTEFTFTVPKVAD